MYTIKQFLNYDIYFSDACHPYEPFRCPGDGHCISIQYLCDGAPDCVSNDRFSFVIHRFNQLKCSLSQNNNTISFHFLFFYRMTGKIFFIFNLFLLQSGLERPNECILHGNVNSNAFISRNSVWFLSDTDFVLLYLNLFLTWS